MVFQVEEWKGGQGDQGGGEGGGEDVVRDKSGEADKSPRRTTYSIW